MNRLTQEEKNEGRRLWAEVWRLWGLHAQRTSWLYDHQDDPRWTERDARCVRGEAEFAAARDALADWCGVTDARVTELVGAAAEGETA